MHASLLIVSSEDYPNPFFRHLETTGFSCLYSRGVLKTREILDTKKIDAIVWLFIGQESALGKDLAKVFNQHPEIPIVLITQNYEQLDFAEEVAALFANLDLNDDRSDMVRTIETACNQSVIKEQIPVIDNTHEIEFRNVVSHVFGVLKNTEGTEKETPKNKLQQVELWEAVDKSEKQILAGKAADEPLKEKAWLPKLKTILKKTN